MYWGPETTSPNTRMHRLALLGISFGKMSCSDIFTNKPSLETEEFILEHSQLRY